ncbi:hypothetical protein [Poseidonibacter ostreae]|uniref:Uncharacterized protein n=1 Tax=Poseidonibacter ostreae TaxID=2654171 RepID=A0A6L4WX78_9BACT|nr:hypothetical protein [Poseidonibacter ostreae]KAB7891353.1 hypothetical protein GBG19_00525 [Poseidonibacter ostreae]
MNEIILADDTNNAHNSTDVENEEIEIKAGQYWVLNKLYNYPKGTLLLVCSLNIIDDILHSIELTPHPTKEPIINTHRIILDNFLDNFDFVPLDEALALREKEINKEQEVINNAREELLLGYVSEDGQSANAIISNVIGQDKSNAENLPMQIGGDIKSYTMQAENIQNIAIKQKEFIESKNEIIVKASTSLASFYQEKGTQALASVDSTIKYVGKLNKGIQTLGLYTGKGVEVTMLSEGKEASIDEPLTFYQRKLFLDEEVFFELKHGGADYNSIANLQEALKANFSIIDRMIPSQRGVALIQYRRKDKEYFSKEDYRDNPFLSMANAQINENNKVRFLLIRNGENVHKIDCEDFFEAKRLFPTALEMDSFFSKNANRSGLDKFRGVDFKDGKINHSDLEYVEARDKHDSKAIFYKRVLIVLSGLQGREENIIGNFKGSEDYLGKWYNLEFQEKCCNFIYDDEDSLDFKLEPIDTWLSNKNKKLMSGSRVLCFSDAMMNTESSPMAVKYFEASSMSHYSRGDCEVTYFKAEDRFSINTAFERNNIQYVKIPCEPTAHSSASAKNINVELRHCRRNTFLVLDDIKKDEIQLYLDSRKAREDYIDYAELLLEAKRVIEIDEKNQEDFLGDFKEHIVKQYDSFDDKLVLNAIDESIRLYRAFNKGSNLPSKNDSSFNKVLNKISKIIHTLLNAETISNKIKLAFNLKDKDKEIIRIVVKNTSEYFLYAKKEQEYKIFNTDNEILEVEQYKIKMTKKDISFTKVEDLYFDDYASERILYEADNSSAMQNVTRSGLDFFRYANNAISDSEKLFDEVANGGISLENTKILLKSFIAKNVKTKRYFKIVDCIIPIGLCSVSISRNTIDTSIFNDDKEEKTIKDKAIQFMTIRIGRIDEFIVKYGNDESFNYLCGIMKSLRFGNVVNGYISSRKNSIKTDKNMFVDFAKNKSIFFGVHAINKTYKLPSLKLGLCIDDEFPTNYSYGSNNFKNIRIENNKASMSEIMEESKKQLKEPFHTHNRYSETIEEYIYEEININKYFK